MTVIRPNSISGITSITAQANDINFFRSDGTLAALQINGINFNNTSGISTLAALNVTGNVSIAGTLTYEDVTNVDSIGIITARDGIDCNGDLDVAGIATLGSGASGYAELFYQGVKKFETKNYGALIPGALVTTNDIKVGSYVGKLIVGTNNEFTIQHDNTNTIIDNTVGILDLKSQQVAISTHLSVGGEVGINSTAPNTKLDVIESIVSRTWTPGSSVVSMFERNGHCRIALVASASSYGEIDFGDTNDDNAGYIRYDHSDNSMSFRTNGSGEALTVDAFGRVLIGGTSAIIGSSSEFAEIVLTGKTRGAGITLQDVDANTRFQIRTDDNGDGTLLNASTNHPLVIRTNNTERLRILSDGKVGIGITNPIGNLHISSGTSGDCKLIIEADTDNNEEGDNPQIEFRQDGGVAISAIEQGNNQLTLSNSVVSDGGIVFETGSTNGYTNAVERMRISSTGAVTKPAQPCAVVYQCTGPAGGAANATSDNKEPLHFDHVHINQGGMTISGNNGRIEVPVTGIYFVSYMCSGTVTSVDQNDGIEFILMVNGNEYPATNSGAEPVFNFGDVANQSEFFANNTLLVSLTGGDYVEVALDNIGSSPGADATINRGNFSIMLMA